ncbi:Ff.00g065470.m01.CDS01 [Fusarium sp. VM40]|nr:Ff.00g065470.m01.CDS01 [Fusarium sp. VM40]
MTILYENIDPDGDTLITISYVAETSQTADELETVAEPAVTEEPVADNEPTAAEVEHSLSELRLKVSKKHLTVASRRARTMFEREYCETQKSEVDGLYHWKIEPLFDPEALKIVLRALHAQAQDLPDQVSLDMMVSIAEVVDDLLCHQALSFFVKVWITRLSPSQSVSSQMCDDLVKWIFVASVFRLDDKFKQATRTAIMYSTGPIDILGLPMRLDISDKIEQNRQDLLQDLINQLHTVLDNLCSGHSCVIPQCALTMIGALTKQMHINNFHSPRPTRPFLNLSLSSTLAAVRCFDSPSLYLPAETISRDSLDDLFFGHKEDFWLLQKETFSSSSRKKKHRGLLEPEDDEATDNTPKKLMVHYCRLQDLLEPGIILVESRLSTLDLGYD